MLSENSSVAVAAAAACDSWLKGGEEKGRKEEEDGVIGERASASDSVSLISSCFAKDSGRGGSEGLNANRHQQHNECVHTFVHMYINTLAYTHTH